MRDLYARRAALKKKFRNRERLFGAWISYSHPSITETMARAGFDFIAIDMEHSTITVEQAQHIIAATQAEGSLCFPRPVSHSNDWIKPLLESGADGMLVQMVDTPAEVKNLLALIKYPPRGRRSFGVNRAQGYGFDFESYVRTWNESSSFIIQIESVAAVDNIDALLAYEDVDAVMLGPYDLSGSLGVPGQLSHPDVIDASKKVIAACRTRGKSCGTQVADPTPDNIRALFELGHTYAVLGSDLFALWKWSERMMQLIELLRGEA
jgi:2-dehydro-3-deoxyglucarate aldolase